MADNNNNTPTTGAGGTFSQLMWQNAAMFFMIYSLIRWLSPDMLPKAILAKSWFDPSIMAICAVPGAILAGIASLIKVGGQPPQSK